MCNSLKQRFLEHKFFFIQGALKFPLQTSRTFKGDLVDNILNWNPCPETYRFRATAPFENKHCTNVPHVSQQAIACLRRITWCHLTFILPLGAGSSLIYMSFSVRATWLSTLLLNTPTWSFCMAKLEVMEELLVAFIKIVFHYVRLHRIPSSP